MQKREDNEYYSEVVRDYLEQIPNKFYRWSNYSMCGLLAVLFLLTFLIKYPTVVLAEFRLLATTTPKPIFAKATGRLDKVFVMDNQPIKKDSCIGYLESTANYEEIIALERELEQLILTTKDDNGFLLLNKNTLTSFKNLGEIQKDYEIFQKHYIELISQFTNNYHVNKLAILNKEKNQLNKIVQNLENQKNTLLRDRNIQEEKFQMNKKLYDNKVISYSDFLMEESKLLAKQLPIKEIENNLANNLLAITEKERAILDIHKIHIEQKEIFKQAIHTIISSILKWKNTYVLSAPISGTISFVKILQEEQNIKENEIIMYVADTTTDYLGEIMIPQDNFGKVKIGQKVLIKLKSYPFQEYGAIEGKIKSIAKIPTADKKFFSAILTLKNKNITTNNTSLIFRDGMQATAEIITEDRKLAEQFFYSIKSIFN